MRPRGRGNPAAAVSVSRGVSHLRPPSPGTPRPVSPAPTRLAVFRRTELAHVVAPAVIAVIAVVVLVAGCSVGSNGTPGASGRPSPSATLGRPLSVPELKLRLVDELGPRWYCDPDFYPLARGDELSMMRQRWPETVADGATLAVILAHENLPPDPATLTDDQKLRAYRLWKALRSIPFDPIGTDRYRFDYLAQPKGGAAEGTRTTGTIDASGRITVEQQAPAPEPNCPICLARGTRIDAPAGAIPVEDLAIGDRVWTLDPDGRRIEGAVIALGSTPAPAGHEVVRLELADGRSVTASPGHPLADGRRLGALSLGDLVDGSVVVGATRLPYGSAETFDLVVSGPTGVYLSDGIPLASTLR